MKSQLLGSAFCAATLVNSKGPFSGHRRYLLGWPFAGSFNVIILASEEMSLGSIKILAGLVSGGGNVFACGSLRGVSTSALEEAFEPRVLAIIAIRK